MIALHAKSISLVNSGDIFFYSIRGSMLDGSGFDRQPIEETKSEKHSTPKTKAISPENLETKVVAHALPASKLERSIVAKQYEGVIDEGYIIKAPVAIVNIQDNTSQESQLAQHPTIINHSYTSNLTYSSYIVAQASTSQFYSSKTVYSQVETTQTDSFVPNSQSEVYPILKPEIELVYTKETESKVQAYEKTTSNSEYRSIELVHETTIREPISYSKSANIESTNYQPRILEIEASVPKSEIQFNIDFANIQPTLPQEAYEQPIRHESTSYNLSNNDYTRFEINIGTANTVTKEVEQPREQINIDYKAEAKTDYTQKEAIKEQPVITTESLETLTISFEQEIRPILSYQESIETKAYSKEPQIKYQTMDVQDELPELDQLIKINYKTQPENLTTTSSEVLTQDFYIEAIAPKTEEKPVDKKDYQANSQNIELPSLETKIETQYKPKIESNYSSNPKEVLGELSESGDKAHYILDQKETSQCDAKAKSKDKGFYESASNGLEAMRNLSVDSEVSRPKLTSDYSSNPKEALEELSESGDKAYYILNQPETSQCDAKAKSKDKGFYESASNGLEAMRNKTLIYNNIPEQAKDGSILENVISGAKQDLSKIQNIEITYLSGDSSFESRLASEGIANYVPKDGDNFKAIAHMIDGSSFTMTNYPCGGAKKIAPEPKVETAIPSGVMEAFFS